MRYYLYIVLIICIYMGDTYCMLTSPKNNFFWIIFDAILIIDIIYKISTCFFNIFQLTTVSCFPSCDWQCNTFFKRIKNVKFSFKNNLCVEQYCGSSYYAFINFLNAWNAHSRISSLWPFKTNENIFSSYYFLIIKSINS